VNASLPLGWTWARASEACLNIQDGTHFSPKVQLPSGEYPYITAKNVRSWGLDLSDITYLTKEDHTAIYRRSSVQKGDVLLVKDGVNTGDACLNTLDAQLSLLSSVCFLRPIPTELRAGFVRYFLLSPEGQRQLTGGMSGTAIRRIVLHKIRELQIPVAPLTEQDRIVAEIEKHLTRLDFADSQLSRADFALARYRTSVIDAATTGRLCGLQRTRTLTNLPSYSSEPSDVPYHSLPAGWTWTTLDKISVDSGYGTSTKCAYDASGFPVLRIPNIARGDIDLSEIKRAPQSLQLKDADALAPGDFLIIRTNGSKALIGRAALIRQSLTERTSFASYLIRFRLIDDPSLRRWVSVAWNAPVIRRQIEMISATSAGQYNVSLSSLNRVAIPVPAPSEREQIVATVERLASSADRLAAAVAANRARSRHLREAILKAAFAGALAAH
jgi:type I restriction enzyme S subunit